jgi:hypothetical protein
MMQSSLLLLLWNCKSVTSLLWIPKTIDHVLGIELHMKRKFTECLTKRHRSTAEYFNVVRQSAVESEDAERGFRTLSGDFEQVTQPQNKSHDVIDMDRSPPVELQKYIMSLLWIPKTVDHVLGIELHMKRKFTECLTKRHRSTADFFYLVTQSAVESKDAERGFRTLSVDFEQVIHLART